MKYISQRYATGLILAFLVIVGFWLGRCAYLPDVQAQATSFNESELTPLRANIRGFFENLSDNSKGAKRALEELLKNSPVSSDEKLVADLATSLKEVNTRFGNYLTFEEAGVRTIGSDLILVRYLYKCQNYPVVWYFTYYRQPVKNGELPSGNWTLIGLRFDSNLDAALRETGF